MLLNNSEKKQKKIHRHSIAAILCLSCLFFWCSLLTQKFYCFGYYDWDLAFFTQATSGLLHGKSSVSLVGIDYFGDHSYFFTFLTLPLFYLAPSALTLIYLKVAAFAFSGFLLYRIAYNNIGQKAALCTLISYFLFPGNLFGLIYEFNPEAFAPPLILLAWQAATKSKFSKFLIWTILLASIKENMCLLAVMLSLYGLLKSPKNKRFLWIVLTIAYSGIFLFLVLQLIPLFRNLPQHAFMVRYSGLGHTTSDLLLSPILHFHEFFKSIFTPLNHNYVVRLFDYLLIPAFFSPGKLLPAAPLLVQHFLSTHPPEHTIFYHYVPTISPFIFLAFINTLKKINYFLMSRWSTIIYGGLFGLAIFSLYSCANDLYLRLNIMNKHQAAEHWQLLNKIPNDAAVIATFDFLAPLSTRAELYSFHKIYDDAFQESKKIKYSELNTNSVFILPANVHYAVINLNDDWMLNSLMKNKQKVSGRIDQFLNNSQWRLIGQTGKTLLLFR